MKVAKNEAGRFQDRYRGARSTAEDAVADIKNAAAEALQNIKWRPNWWNGADGEPVRKNSGGLDRVPISPSLAAPATTPVPSSGVPRSPPLAPAAAPAPRSPPLAPAPPPPEPVSACSAPPAGEDDAAMRYHFAALERLVAMGLSPQAARSSLRHMDEWLVSEAGANEMSRAEVRAREAGEFILHINDQVRLEGLVKNNAANGKMAVLQTYVASSQRWKVGLSDGKAYLLQPKFLHPVVLRPTPLMEQLQASATEASPEQQSSIAPDHLQSTANEAVALKSVMEELERRQVMWQEAQQAKEIELLEKEECLRKQQEELEAQQRILCERRRSVALDQARNLAALEKQAATPEQKGIARRPTAEFVMDDISPAAVSTSVEEVEAEECEEEEPVSEGEDVWDMDWTALASGKSSASAASQSVAVEPEPLDTSSDQAGVVLAGSRSAACSTGAGQQPQIAPPASAEAKQLLQRKLEEKRQLADLHNGEDLTNVRRPSLQKESMPGAHPLLAAKLEERRRLAEEAEEQRQNTEDEAF